MGYDARRRLSSVIGILVILALSAAIGLAIALLSGPKDRPPAPVAWQVLQPTATPSPTVTPEPELAQRANTPTRAATPIVRPLRANTLTSEPLPRSTTSLTVAQTALRALTSIVVEATPTPSATPTALQPVVTALLARASAPQGETVAPPAVTVAAGQPTPSLPTSPTRRPAAATPPAPRTAVAVAQPPNLLLPDANGSGRGVVLFTWSPTAALPSGAAYEVVWWFPGQDPATATGMAAPTAETSLQINLDALYESGAFAAPQFYWTVLVVQPDPYVRLTSPSLSPAHQFVYDTGGVPLLKP